MNKYRATRLVVASAMVAAFALPAAAHVGLEPSEFPPGSGQTLSFRIGHGCEGEATTSVSIRIPAGVASVSPFPKAGWDLTTESGELPEPIETEDGEITFGVTVVTWSGSTLEDAFTDTFQLRATVYGEEGSAVYFPVVQTCATGEHAWIEVPTEGQDGHDLESPAPRISLSAAPGPPGSADTVTIVALVVAVLGFAMGCLALLRGRASS